MKVNIKGKEIELKYTVRSMMNYESIMGKTFAPEGITEIVIYFYATILASSKDTSISYDDFIEWFDENQPLDEFTQWLNTNLTVNDDLRKKPKLPKKK